MGVRYDKVVARKKAKLREQEREAKHQSLVEEMQGILDEMVINREERLWQRFLSLIDDRKDDNPNDSWMVLKGASEENAYIGYAPSPTRSGHCMKLIFHISLMADPGIQAVTSAAANIRTLPAIRQEEDMRERMCFIPGVYLERRQGRLRDFLCGIWERPLRCLRTLRLIFSRRKSQRQRHTSLLESSKYLLNHIYTLIIGSYRWYLYINSSKTLPFNLNWNSFAP